MNNILEIKLISEQKGKGIIAKKNIKKGTIVDIANIILLNDEDYDLIKDTILYGYIYEWDHPDDTINNAIALGICQFVNHSYQPNLKYEYDYKKELIIYLAIKDIPIGEELTVNYNGIVKDNSPLWFEVI